MVGLPYIDYWLRLAGTLEKDGGNFDYWVFFPVVFVSVEPCGLRHRDSCFHCSGTPMVQALEKTPGSVANKVDTKTRLIPLGRQGTADEVARMMLFLASEDAGFCTGGVYMVDGGVTAGLAA